MHVFLCMEFFFLEKYSYGNFNMKSSKKLWNECKSCYVKEIKINTNIILNILLSEFSQQPF